MKGEQNSTVRMETGHVLFMDIVEYSTGLTEDQAEARHELNHIVRNTQAVRKAEAAGS